METKWIDDVFVFADALEKRAAARSEPFFRVECRADVEYLRKAAQLLKMVTEAFVHLSGRVDQLYTEAQNLDEAAAEAIRIVKNQQKLHELWPGFEHEPPHNKNIEEAEKEKS